VGFSLTVVKNILYLESYVSTSGRKKQALLKTHIVVSGLCHEMGALPHDSLE
jgi:hypothetical protein